MTTDRDDFNAIVERMREAEDRMEAAGDRLSKAQIEEHEATGQWQAARRAILTFEPTSAPGAVALLRWAGSEMDCADLHEEIAAAIGRAVKVLEAESRL